MMRHGFRSRFGFLNAKYKDVAVEIGDEIAL
jgi:hypothetical protein